MPITPDQLAVPTRIVSVDLVHADIIALPTVAKTVLAAPGVGYVNLPTFGSLRIDTSAGYYDNYDASCTLAIKYYNSSLFPLSIMFGNSGSAGSVPDLLGAENDAYSIFMPTQVANAAKTLGYTILLADAENKAIELSVVNGSPDLGNFTGGNAANTGRITLEYRKLNLLTGLFE